MKNVKLGIIALLAITGGVSAFTAKAKASATKVANHASAAFTYFILQTLAGGTRLITTNAIVCPGSVSVPCQAQFDVQFSTDNNDKFIPAGHTPTALSFKQ